MRILELSTEGFVQRQFVAPLAAHLRANGHEVYPLNGEGISIRRTISPWDVVAVGRLWWRLKRLHIDTLHVQTAKAGAVGRIAAWLAGTPRVVYTAHAFPFHDGLPRWRHRLYVWIERILAKTCQAITVDSPAVKNQGLQWRIAPSHKIHVIPVGVDTDWFDPTRYPKAESPWLTIGTVARLVPEKNIAFLIELLATLIHQTAFAVRGLIVGDGPERRRLQHLIEQRQLQRVVQLTGAQEDVAPALAQMDLFVLPTEREGLSKAVMEAMSMAKPVVVTDLPSFRELVLHEQTGLLARPPDWMDAISRLLRSPERRSSLGQSARAHVQKYYEQSVQCQAYERVLCP